MTMHRIGVIAIDGVTDLFNKIMCTRKGAIKTEIPIMLRITHEVVQSIENKRLW